MCNCKKLYLRMCRTSVERHARPSIKKPVLIPGPQGRLLNQPFSNPSQALLGPILDPSRTPAKAFAGSSLTLPDPWDPYRPPGRTPPRLAQAFLNHSRPLRTHSGISPIASGVRFRTFCILYDFGIVTGQMHVHFFYVPTAWRKAFTDIIYRCHVYGTMDRLVSKAGVNDGRQETRKRPNARKFERDCGTGRMH